MTPIAQSSLSLSLSISPIPTLPYPNTQQANQAENQ
jgi:hypothetical protein